MKQAKCEFPTTDLDYTYQIKNYSAEKEVLWNNCTVFPEQKENQAQRLILKHILRSKQTWSNVKNQFVHVRFATRRL